MASSSSSASSSAPSLLRVLGIAQSYEWGKHGSASAVGQLMSAAATANAGSVPPFDLQASKPYAELWLGTHPSGPSRVLPPSGGDSVPLSEHLQGELPFLFKVLSVGKALSIQAHPDASLARQLHSSRPDVYKDGQHKPELACALGPFEAMCSFRPLGEVARHAREFPELAAIIGEQLAGKLQDVAGQLGAEDVGANLSESQSAERKELLQRIFEKMMTPSPELLKEQLAKLEARLRSEGVQPSAPTTEVSANMPPVSPLPVSPLILRLSAQYPGDLGVFAPLVLNCLVLRPGSAIFLGPREPHAYLAGDCIECMACSDNVVRAGLTPKFRDTDVLVQMLTYAEHTGSSALMRPSELAGGKGSMTEFAPPKEFGEFRLVRAEVNDQDAATLPPVSGASIMLVYSGEGSAQLLQGSGSDSTQQQQPLRRGDAFLVPANCSVQLRRQEGSKEGALQVFQCTANEAK